MSVAAATGGAVSTPHHQQPTAEQIRLAQLTDDKKHDQREVQESVRKVLDVVANATQEEALVALYDCDYDYERAVAMLIEKGHDIASEWRTATNHKATKKQQQQQKTASVKNGHGGETDENAQARTNDSFTYRGKSRGGRSRFQQADGGDSQSTQQQSDSYVPQPRQRGGSNNRGRFRGNNRGGPRTNERSYAQQQQQQPLQESTVDTSSPSDTAQRSTEGGGGGNHRQQESQRWDVGNWNGETLIYSRSSKDDEQTMESGNNNVSNTSHAPAGVSNGQYPSLKTSNVNNVSERNTQQQSKANFDPVEAARHIKNVIGIGQTQAQQQQNVPPTQPLMDIKPLMGEQQAGPQQQKSNTIPAKSTGQTFHTKVTPPPQRIPHQPVIFSDRFDGGMTKIDVQFGNLNEGFDESAMQNPSVSIPSSSSSAFYQPAEPSLSGTKSSTSVSLGANSQRSTEPSAFVSPPMHTNAARSTEQQSHASVMNQPRVLPQPSMTMKPVVPPAYAVHHQQHPLNAQNLLLHPLVFHPQQQETVPLDASFDPAVFQLPSIDLTSPYFMATMNQQPPQNPARFLVTQPPHQQQQQQQQQNVSNRQSSSTNVPAPSSSTPSASVPSSSTSTTSATAPKKGPAVPPGIFLPTAPQTQQAYSTNYGVPLSIGRQQQTGASNYPYDTDHLFTNAYMQLTNPQQAQSPSGAYGSVTPPVQQSNQGQQQAHTANDNKGLNYANQFHENLLMLQQFQQIHIPQSNSQQQSQQPTHSPAPLNFFLGHPGNGPNYSQGPSMMYAQPPAAMAQQQAAKQQYTHNNSSSSSGAGGNDHYYGRNSSSSTKDTQYMYNVSGQPQQVSSQSAGQQQGGNKPQQQQQQQHQQQQRPGNVYNNQANSQRSYH